MKPETIISEERLHKGNSLGFSLRQVSLPDDTIISREIGDNNGAIVIVALTENNEVRLVKQYRSAAEDWIIELPAGGLEPNEDPDEAAPRELLEEVGDRAARWRRLGGFYSAPGILTEYLHIYLATELTPGPNQPEFDEFIEVLTIPWVEVMAMITRNEINDGKTIAALMMTALHLGRL